MDTLDGVSNDWVDGTQSTAERQDRFAGVVARGLQWDMADGVREPLVAGSFYPAHAGRLRDLIDGFSPGVQIRDLPLSSPVGLIAPHAGYVFSGGVAAQGFAAVASRGKPDVVVLLGANHTGLGPSIALAPHSAWRTPLGEARVDGDLVAVLVRRGLPMAEAPFLREHSIEVQIPFVQVLWGVGCAIVPICVAPGSLSRLREAAETLVASMGERRALLVASSDFTHYESDQVARSRDRRALQEILALDVHGFHARCREEGLSICGTGAIEMLMYCAHRLSLDHVEQVAYATSGDMTGDTASVVGYAAVLMTKE